MALQESIDFVVGGEKRLTDVLSEAEVMPLLKSAAQAGLELAAVIDTADIPLWTFGPGCGVPGAFPPRKAHIETRPIYLAGEQVGKVCLAGGIATAAEVLKILAQVVGDAVNSMVQTNLKRMMVTEIHTQVVQLSYDELLETNRLLTESEQKYRELAQNLEIRVQERTSELKQVYTRMLQQEKMASVGQLAAGMAHEINNPLSFILSNLKSLEKYVGRFVELVNFYEEQTGGSGNDKLRSAATEKRRSLKIDFIMDDLGELFTQTVGGAERVKKLSPIYGGFLMSTARGKFSWISTRKLKEHSASCRPRFPLMPKLSKSWVIFPGCPVKCPCCARLSSISSAMLSRPGRGGFIC